ncbi:MAG TPA: methyltransferase domain-containing protein [Stellaceae bacterium]|jgi:SAM-dependent methyltransferase|nr:methyltransferase domain-containing protein [Stellaceae bacterium]
MPGPAPQPSPITVFDRPAQRRHRTRAAATGAGTGIAGIGGDAGFLFREGAERLLDRLADIKRPFARALDLDSRDRLVAAQLRAVGIETVVAGEAGPLTIDLEALPFAPGSFDLVTSSLAFHWVNDLPGTLLQLRHILKPDGLLLINLFAGETLESLRVALLEAESEIENGASPRISPFADPRDLAGLLQRAGFALPVVDSDRVTVDYPDAWKLMRDLRAMGETNATALRHRHFSRRATMLRAAEIYRERFGNTEGRIPAEFEIATLTAWAPHATQQRPLRPGSATTRLADALDTEERPAGDRATP